MDQITIMGLNTWGKKLINQPNVQKKPYMFCYINDKLSLSLHEYEFCNGLILYEEIQQDENGVYLLSLTDGINNVASSLWTEQERIQAIEQLPPSLIQL